MRRKGILAVLCAVLAVLLSACEQNALPSSEAPSSSEEKIIAVSPDASYTPPEAEEPPIQSQPSVEAETTPWGIVKAASELPLQTPAKTKTVTLPDKTVTATYTGKGYRETANTTPYYAYETDDGDVLQFDAVGGELVYYERTEKPTDEEKTITLAQAQAVAETFVREHIDLSRYQPPNQHVESDGTYWFQYVRYIGDMPTQDMVNIDVSPSGELLRYWSNPHVFDCIQIGTVDKAAIRQRFEETLRALGQSLDYTLVNEIIGLNAQGEPCVKYEFCYGDLTAIGQMEIPLTEQAE